VVSLFIDSQVGVIGSKKVVLLLNIEVLLNIEEVHLRMGQNQRRGEKKGRLRRQEELKPGRNSRVGQHRNNLEASTTKMHHLKSRREDLRQNTSEVSRHRIEEVGPRS